MFRVTKKLTYELCLNLPAPRIELAMLAIESSMPPPAVLLAAISSRSGTSSPITACLFEDERRVEEPKLRLEADESTKPTRSGIDRSPLRLLRGGVACSSCRRVSSSRSSESCSNSTLCWESSIHDMKSGVTGHTHTPISRLDNVDRREGAMTCIVSWKRTVWGLDWLSVFLCTTPVDS